MKKSLFILFQVFTVLTSFAQTQIKVTTSNLNLRSSPTVYGNIEAIIPRGTNLNIGYTGDSEWALVNYNGINGYVSARYIKIPTSKYENNKYRNGHSTNSSIIKYYKNSAGEMVQSPTYYNTTPASATALCRDGTYSFSRSSRGTCSHHGGVAKWL